MKQSRAALLAIAIVIPLAMAATAYTGKPASQDNISADKKIRIIASFYPLYDFASHVAGDRAEVSSMIPAGIEPHDWEPTAGDVLKAGSADMLVINGAGFERWAENISARRLVVATDGLQLDGGNEESGHDEGIDPHVWLDPVLAKHEVESIRVALVEIDPINAGYYNDNAARFTAELDLLDKQISGELSDCQKSDFIAFHDAFSRFAQRYGLTQHGIQGISPEGEILPQRIEQVIGLANDLHIDTIYSEELVDSRLAEVIANEIPGGRVLVLSPIEGIDSEEQAKGIGYIDKMQQNLANLKEGLKCTS